VAVKKYPTQKQIKELKEKGWKFISGSKVAMKSPYHRQAYYTPRQAMAIERIRNK
jgi:hypothetical protein